MKKIILILLLQTLSQMLFSQESFEEYKKQIQSDYSQYKSQREKELAEYRDQINKEFEEFMRKAWSPFDSEPAKPVPAEPKPVVPPKCDPAEPPRAEPIKIDPQPVLVPPPVPVAPPAPPAPAVPIPVPTTPAQPRFAFSFYGTSCTVTLGNEHRFTLNGIDENATADAWQTLSNARYNAMLIDCLELRNKLNLCDWGYYRLTEEMTKKFCAGEKNKARLIQMYILTQSGYQVRIARCDNELVLLLPLTESLPGNPYITIGGIKHYVMNSVGKSSSYYVLEAAFPKEQMMTFSSVGKPNLATNRMAKKSFTCDKMNGKIAYLAVNKNLIDFYDDFPRVDWGIYAIRSLNDDTKKELYPTLREAIEGKSEVIATGILLDFVQNAFQYKTDDAQFGCERPLFADETFYYPYCDCEDRSILFSVLVKDLLDLDVVLLHYPGHLATAVQFKHDVKGDYLHINGMKYVVCDPTYIGASVGMSMPGFKNVAAKIVR